MVGGRESAEKRKRSREKQPSELKRRRREIRRKGGREERRRREERRNGGREERRRREERQQENVNWVVFALVDIGAAAPCMRSASRRSS